MTEEKQQKFTSKVRRGLGEPLPSPKGESAGEDWSISGDGD